MPEIWLIVLPLILWFVEQLLPFPALVEEPAKAFFIRRAGSGKQALTWGMLFGASEAILFLVNAIQLQSLAVWWPRLILTVPMHGLASLIFYRCRNRWWLGLIFAVLVHAVFNQLVRR